MRFFEDSILGRVEVILIFHNERVWLVRDHKNEIWALTHRENEMVRLKGRDEAFAEVRRHLKEPLKTVEVTTNGIKTVKRAVNELTTKCVAIPEKSE